MIFVENTAFDQIGRYNRARTTMVYCRRVVNGVVALFGDTKFPDGTKVHI
jgi:hypothetical protein